MEHWGAEDLEEPSTESEVREVFSMDGDKASRPDGFPGSRVLGYSKMRGDGYVLRILQWQFRVRKNELCSCGVNSKD